MQPDWEAKNPRREENTLKGARHSTAEGFQKQHKPIGEDFKLKVELRG